MPVDFDARVSPKIGGALTSIQVTQDLLERIFSAEKSDLYVCVTMRLNRAAVMDAFGVSAGGLVFAGDMAALAKAVAAIGEARCKELNDALDARIATIDVQLRQLAAELDRLRPHITGELHPDGVDNAIISPDYGANLISYGSKLRLQRQLSDELSKLLLPSSTWRVAHGSIVETNIVIEPTVEG